MQLSEAIDVLERQAPRLGRRLVRELELGAADALELRDWSRYDAAAGELRAAASRVVLRHGDRRPAQV